MQTNSYTSSSNRKRFIWVKIIIFIVILLVILNYIGNYFEDISDKNEIASYYEIAWDSFYKFDPHVMDVLFLGSSHAYCSFDPEIMDNGLGTNSFNLGSPLQHGDSSYFVLKEAIKDQKPEVLVFEIYWDMLDDEFELKQAETVIKAVKKEEFEDKFIKEAFPFNEVVKYHFRPIRYQQDVFNYWNKEVKVKAEEKFSLLTEDNKDSNGESYYKDRGFIYSDIVIPESEFYETNQFVGFDGANWEFDKTQKLYMEKLVDLANEEGIKTIFVTAPIANISMEHIQNYDALHNKIADFAKELGVPYRDYNIVNMEENLFVNENFRDDAHLNYSGVEIFMEDFIEWFKEVS